MTFDKLGRLCFKPLGLNLYRPMSNYCWPISRSTLRTIVPLFRGKPIQLGRLQYYYFSKFHSPLICAKLNSSFSTYQFNGRSSDIPPAKVGQAATEDAKREFLAVFPDIVRDVTNTTSNAELVDVEKWYAKMLQYNVLGGKMNRGLAVSLSLKRILPSEQFDDATHRKALILGWCIELSHFLVADDIIDGSETRRGKICWYKNKDVGLGAINDSLLLNSGIYHLLKIHFRDESYYLDILELFHDVTMKTILGQCLDLKACPINDKPRLDKFTMDHYDAIVKHKTAYYSFYLPVALAMYMAGIRETDYKRVAEITDRELHRQARTILLEMGSFFQVQDDYLDCFGNPIVTGKTGTDISEGKCTWLAVVALQRASRAQREVMEEHYGRNEQSSVDAIRQLYKDLKLPATYKAYEESTSSMIKTHIQQISRGLNHKLFFKLLDQIYNRSS